VAPPSVNEKENSMSEHTYRVVEVVGSSPTSSDDAIRNAIVDAAKTIRNIGWYKVIETRGHVEADKIAHYQVTLKIGFTLDDR
jgi:flavin-binding protein dodecin